MSGLLKRLLFPPKCAACRALADWYREGSALCERCFAEWSYETHERCSVCGDEVRACKCMPMSMQKAKCAMHRKLVYYYPATRKKVQNKILYAIKEGESALRYEFLAKEMLPQIEEATKEVPRERLLITFLPRSRAAKERYGHDQAELLARAISKRSGIPCAALIKRVGGSEQKNLSVAQRLANAKNAFLPDPEADIKGKTLLLVDDMVTTGAGMAEATRKLLHRGAEAVYCFSVATDVCNREMT